MSQFSDDKGYLAFRLLQIGFVVAPIAAGLDKFFYVLTDWNQYVSPIALNVVEGYLQTFFMVVGVVEIVAGIGVAIKPKIFAYVVALWLLLIIVNLVTIGQYFDIALRDVGLLIGAVALGLLSQKYDRPKTQPV